MGRCAVQLVLGPAGSGKSTYCAALQAHGAAALARTVHVANLDPACDTFQYEACLDVRDLIGVDDAMAELGLGPNGGLLYCMEYLLDNLDWLEDGLAPFGEDDYLLLDCPGQVELYTHVPVMRRLIGRLQEWGRFDLVGVFLLDAAFLVDADKFLAGSLLALSAMVALELPHVNVLSKCDLMAPEEVDAILDQGSAIQLWERDQARRGLPTAAEDPEGNGAPSEVEAAERRRLAALEPRRRRRGCLTDAIAQLLDDYQMVGFVPLNIKDEDSLGHVLAVVDHAVQYGEDLEVREADFGDGAGGDMISNAIDAPGD